MKIKQKLQAFARNNAWILKTAWRFRDRMGMLKHNVARRVTEPDDLVVIEGYPRSANTFACDAFVVAQGYSPVSAATIGYPVKMGNHFHTPAQFMLARSYAIPAMLVIREPVAAALSWVVFTDGEMNAEDTLRDYISFHEPLLKIRDSFVVAPFEEVTGDFGKSIDRLNARFGTNFCRFEHTEQSQAQIFAAMEERLRIREARRGESLSHRRNSPHASKSAKRREFALQFESPKLVHLKARATALYQTLTAAA